MLFVFNVFLAITFIQFAYYLGVFSIFSFSKKNNTFRTQTSEPVSVIICARNEEKNLQQFLPFFIEQNYANFELVLVNDSSTDTTLQVMETFKEKYPTKINIVNITADKNYLGNKKKALSLGIKVAKNNYLLFSDADCKPNSKNWILEITQHFSEEKSIVLGYGAHQKNKKNWLNKLIRFETLFTAIQYFSYAKIGLPYMGVGRNLAYKKFLFTKNNGFANHAHIKSGDDDLFVNQNATKNNTAIAFTKNSYTISTPKTSFKKWMLQKRRHISTATHYKPIHQLLLGLFYSSQLLFWVVGTFLLTSTIYCKTTILLIVIRIAIQYIIVGLSAKKLDEKDLIIWLPILEIFIILMQISIFIKNKVSKPIHW